jgi:squalene-associated FAD-dependent desaturase
VTDARPHVVVVGGGFAGLTAAVRLTQAGVRVTVVERRPFLGGRAYSFPDPVTGDVIDNGPHAFMGAYTALARFLDEIGAPDAIAFQPRLCVPMRHPELGGGAIMAGRVPGVLQPLAALARYRLLSRRDRLGLVAASVRVVARTAQTLAGTTVATLLDRLGQSAAARRCFWDPLVIATLNEDPVHAAAAPFAAVLRRGFLAGAGAARFGVARGPLGDVWARPARQAIERAEGTVLTGATVAEVVLADERAAGVRLRDGRQVAADAVVLALPASAVHGVLPPGLREATAFRRLATVATSPIVSVHLWTDRAVRVGMPAAGAPFVGLLGCRAQWLFDTGPSVSGGRKLATVTSGARCWDGSDDATIVREVTAELHAMVPGFAATACQRAHVVRERHATLALTPEADAARPDVQTPVRNLALAGDWVQTGLPATIESAVVSGGAAAAHVHATLPRARARAAA